ncbi:ADP-ribosylglycohydrolase family protein [Plantibacter sp. Mn2098]|uniref:ADP-ribosylglycohydrolase family protein n=1 Tax=Plantibacter sp. Mn2098 TaxID=3395266 RepID=UPI003BC3602F
MSAAPQHSRALGALYGLAIGDALGMPTQDLTPAQIRADYGTISGFVDAGPHQLIAAGMQAGSITDDTEQVVLLARLLLDDVDLDPMRFASALSDWEDAMRAKGSLDLLGPSTKAAIELIKGGASPEVSGRGGTTNGAAMRIAPVGIAFPADDLDALIERVVQASAITHNTSVGIAAAAAVAGAVSAGISGATLHAAIDAGLRAAELGASQGIPVGGPRIARRSRWAIDYLGTQDPSDYADVIGDVIGTSFASHESVVAALAISAVVADPWEAMLLSANVGGDTDTIATIVGAITGSVAGLEALPAEAIELVKQQNGLDFEPTARGLLAIRARFAAATAIPNSTSTSTQPQ